MNRNKYHSIPLRHISISKPEVCMLSVHTSSNAEDFCCLAPFGAGRLI